MTDGEFARLPHYVKREIEELRQQRDVAVLKLKQYENDQIVSPFWTEELLCDGTQQGPRITKRYIQCHEVNVHEYHNPENYVALRRTWDGELYLGSGNGQLIIIPQASNGIQVKVGK